MALADACQRVGGVPDQNTPIRDPDLIWREVTSVWCRFRWWRGVNALHQRPARNVRRDRRER